MSASLPPGSEADIIEARADSNKPLLIIAWWGLNPGGAANINPIRKNNNNKT